MNNINCTGSERSLYECDQNSIGENDCGHEEDVSITCTACNNNLYSNLRLVDKNGMIVAGARAGSKIRQDDALICFNKNENVYGRLEVF